METQNIMNPDVLREYIQHKIKKEVSSAASDIADKACAELRKEILSQVDRVALSLLQEYTVEHMGTSLRITVNKTHDP